MLKRTLITLFVCLAILAAGCVPTGDTATPEPGEVAATIVTATPMVVVITSTPLPVAAGEMELQNSLTPFMTATDSASSSESTSTPTPSGPINITKILDKGNGTAVVQWTADGEFPSGFITVWSSVNTTPAYPNDKYSYTNDPTARAALVSGSYGTKYYVRVCRFTGEGCDEYSNAVSFTLKYEPTAISYSGSSSYSYTSTPKLTAYNSEGTAVSSSSTIAITSITNTATGQARIYWLASGSFTRGFKIVYSTTDKTPTFGENPYYAIGDDDARDAYVNGNPGTKYYYRVCRFTGTTCDIYSNTYTFTYSGTAVTNTPDPSDLTITSITDSSVGKAIVRWTAVGDFPYGFKVMYSKTNTTPTLSNTVVTVSDGTLRSAYISGTVGTSYYVRVCKYYDGACAAYSPTVTFTFAAATATTDSATISITGADNTTLGNGEVTWSASGTFSEGFIVMYSSTHTTPTVSDETQIVGSSVRTATISGIPGTTYYVAVCKNISGSCGVTSSVVPLHLADDTASLSGLTAVDVSSGSAELNWTSSGTFPDGIRVLMSTSNSSPTISDSIGTISGSLTNTTISGTAGTRYYIRLCKVFDTGCSVYSNSVTFTFADIDITGVTDAGNGTATLTWTAKGDFSDGFKIISSDSNNPPTLSDSVATAGGSATSATISGTIGTTYYYIVCQSDGGSGCLIESAVETFTFSSLAITSAYESPAGTGNLTWTRSGDFSNGISIIFNMEKTVTTITDADGSVTVSGSLTGDSFDLYPQVIPGTTMHYRLCQSLGSSKCGLYSNEVTITFTPEIAVTSFTSGSGQVTIAWSNSGTYPPDGYVILRGTGATDPIRDVPMASSASAGYTDTTVISGTTYTYRICGLDGSYYTSCSVATSYTAP